MAKELEQRKIALSYVHDFLVKSDLPVVARKLVAHVEKQKLCTTAEILRKPTTPLLAVLSGWRKSQTGDFKDNEWFAAESDSEMDESSDSEDDSTSSEDSTDDSSDESSEDSDPSSDASTHSSSTLKASPTPANVPLPDNKSDNPSSDSIPSSSSDDDSSDESSDSDDSSDDSSSSSSSSDSGSDDSDSDSSSSSSSSSSSDSESSSSDSSEDSESSSDSDDSNSSSDSDSESDAIVAVSGQKRSRGTVESDDAKDPIVSIHPIEATLPSKKRAKHDSTEPTDLVTVTKASGRSTNIPFSRIDMTKIEYANDALRTNAYIGPDNEFGAKASADLLKTRGKGFTKEKNKKKRGAYKGGNIDQTTRSFRFDD